MSRDAEIPAAIYGRTSKAPRGWKPSFKREKSPGSWEQQLARLQDWAPAHGYRIVLEGHDVRSGADTRRPGWERVFAEAKGHHVAAIICTKVDRLARSTADFYDIARELTRLNVDLIFTDSEISIRGKDPFNKAVLGILAVVAELELDLIRERTAASMHIGKDGRVYGPRSSRPSGRPPEYGKGHRFRMRNGHRIHDKPRCLKCRAAKRGSERSRRR